MSGSERDPAPAAGPVLITGGAGFIGSNLADHLLRDGRALRILDNLKRPGTEQNLRWLQRRHPGGIDFRLADVRDTAAVRRAVEGVGEVYHFAAQVAVTTSLRDPAGDFEVNARGCLNLLEALRRCPSPPPLLFTSTNKVYGGLRDLPLREHATRYEPADPALARRGIGEERPLEFCSPYGCSKGAADQYVLDYARTFGLPAVVLRMSCIYGPRQFGTEDQGWVAHFLIKALRGEPITIYGDGRQVRDILFAADLVEALLAARARANELTGRAFNIGGGPDNSVSLLELLERLGTLLGRPPAVHFTDWRAADQRYWVCDTTRFGAATGWRAQVGVDEGLTRLYRWLAEHHGAAPGERVAL